MASRGSLCAPIPTIAVSTTACVAPQQAGQAMHRDKGAPPRNGDCAFLIDPDRSAHETAIFWRPEFVASVLLLEAAPAVFRMARRLEQLDLSLANVHAQRGSGAAIVLPHPGGDIHLVDRKSTRLHSSH